MDKFVFGYDIAGNLTQLSIQARKVIKYYSIGDEEDVKDGRMVIVGDKFLFHYGPDGMKQYSIEDQKFVRDFGEVNHSLITAMVV
jgi:hypothetical protein